MLKSETILNSHYIKGIKRLDYKGASIGGELSENIEIINDILKQKINKGVKATIIFAENENIRKFNFKIEQNIEHLDNIINDILEDKIFIINMMKLKLFDDYTFYHGLNVGVLSIAMGAELRLNKEELHKLSLSAFLHDIGKIFIKKEILNKPGKLTNEEFEEIKKHSKLGYKYLKKEFDIPIKSCNGILDHHERFNGTGYPNGIKDTDISLFGRIISIADVYDALTSDRPYKKAFSPSEAMEYIIGNCGEMFDPELVKIFVLKITPYIIEIS